jgi:peptidoglycan hydrolase-like protein with peptidoglycan-binding domain
MKRICFAFLALLLASTGAIRADQTTSAVQQALKDQGFYYGEVTGQKNAETTAAIRRYQIRNGLQITGEIDAETLRSLGVGSSAGAAAASPAAPEPAATPTEGDTNDDNVPGQSAEISRPKEPVQTAPQRAPEGYYAPGPRGSRPEGSGVFYGTPYEMAPPDLQRHVIAGAQTLLARAGYYRSGIDGEFGPGTAAAVRAFQHRMGIVPDGRLNMETLSALGLLPGQHGPRMQRRRALPRRPIYRGQWIPE